LHSPDADHWRPDALSLENSPAKREGAAKKDEGGRIMNCPDCGHPIFQVVVERFQTKIFTLNHETKEKTPLSSAVDWETNDHAYHCANCDSLNIDGLLCKYKIKE
jgi:DNA-directed RNA polymerase subunit RPC12/RpoP